MKTEHSFVHTICPGRCHIGEGLLPERSVGVKAEEQRRLNLTYAWQLQTMTDKGRQYTSCTVVELASGKSMHNQHS